MNGLSRSKIATVHSSKFSDKLDAILHATKLDL
jgi:hypothetical protein